MLASSQPATPDSLKVTEIGDRGRSKYRSESGNGVFSPYTRRALVFAPPPPPPGGVPGGIGAITAILMRELGPRAEIGFASPLRKEESGRLGIRRGLVNAARLVRETGRICRHGTVLFFSSAGFSFWEKCAWSLIVRLMGRRVSIVMVAGDFPNFFTSLSGPARHVAQIMLSGGRVTIGAQSGKWEHYFRETFPRTPIERVSASVDREFFELNKQVKSEDGALHILYVGWITEAKGVLDLLDAAAIVLSGVTRPFHLQLVGPLLDGEARWQREIDKRSLSMHTTLAGSVDNRADLLREYQAADIFVFASHFEGFPVALLEAAAVGLPCIGTRVGGIPDILDDGRAGIIIPAHATGELAAALRTMIMDDERRAAMGEKLRMHALREYTPDACATSYLRLLGIE